MRMLLTAALIIVSSIAQAVPVNPNAPSGIAAMSESNVALLVDGSVWAWSGSEWQEEPVHVPFPVNEIQDWVPRIIVKTTGEIWTFHTGVAGDVWIQVALPIMPISSDSATIGDVKRMFR